jgi:hypothetical protein
MLRHFTPFLIIATLLTCPYVCLAAMVGDQTDESATRFCCAGCCHESLPAGDGEPAPDDRSWNSCLCAGALHEIGEVELASPIVAPDWGVTIASAVSAPGNSIAFYRLGLDRLRVHGGALRIALQSFLC